MNQARSTAPISLLILLLLALGIGWMVIQDLQQSDPTGKAKSSAQLKPVPVEVASVQRGPMQELRSFTGTLEARAEFMVAPKISGRVERLAADLADVVERGSIVAELDNAEHLQDVARAEADLQVARANLAAAQSQLTIARRELDRFDKLSKQGVSSESLRDTAKAEQLARQAEVEVGRAQIQRALADLEAARIRLGYTQVRADWRGGSEQRVVAERFVDEGETVSANTPLLRIVELDPITAVFFITEKDYAFLQVGQTASLRTDAHPGRVFTGTITRIAPVFQENTRQARVELVADNPSLPLKPGMFVRADVVLREVQNATIVPEQALLIRDDQEGLFQVDGARVRWRPVRIGIRRGDTVQVLDSDLDGQVVVLGQQLLDDGSAIHIPAGTP